MHRGGPLNDGPRGGRGGANDGPRGGRNDGPGGGRMSPPERYKMRQNLVSLGDDFWIETATGRRAFKVNGKAIALVNKLVLEDLHGRELLQIQAKVVTVRQGMDIERPGGRGAPLATIKKDLINVVRDEYKVDVPGYAGDLEVRGNIMDHEYKIIDARTRREVAEVTKKWIAVVDNYTIDIHGGTADLEDFLILGICVAVDQMSHDQRLPDEQNPVGVHTVNQGNHAGGAVAAGTTAGIATNPAAGAAAVTVATGSVAAGVATAAVAQAAYAPPPGAPPAPIAAPPAPAVAPLPAGWMAQLDPPSGRYFFINTTMNPPFTTWDDPRTAAIEQPPVMPQ